MFSCFRPQRNSIPSIADCRLVETPLYINAYVGVHENAVGRRDVTGNLISFEYEILNFDINDPEYLFKNSAQCHHMEFNEDKKPFYVIILNIPNHQIKIKLTFDSELHPYFNEFIEIRQSEYVMRYENSQIDISRFKRQQAIISHELCNKPLIQYLREQLALSPNPKIDVFINFYESVPKTSQRQIAVEALIINNASAPRAQRR